MAELTIYNTSKSRLENIKFEFMDQNTTWFEDNMNDQDVHMITDAFGGLLITLTGYYYPFWFADHSRAKIAYDDQKALNLLSDYIEGE